MVHIELPVVIGAGEFPSLVERVGIQLGYSDTPIVLETQLYNMESLFRELFQYRKLTTLEVTISDIPRCVNILNEIFETNMFVSDMSLELLLKEHLSAALAVELSKTLGIRALGSNVAITTNNFLRGIAESLVNSFITSPTLPRYLVEQFMLQSPNRFLPGKNDVFQPIPFEIGDTLSFYLTLRFDTALIENIGHTLTNFLVQNELPDVRFVLRFSFTS